MTMIATDLIQKKIENIETLSTIRKSVTPLDLEKTGKLSVNLFSKIFAMNPKKKKSTIKITVTWLRYSSTQ